jgi:hypothetical protein
MLSLSKHLYHAAWGTNLKARARCFDKLSMTFFFTRTYAKGVT